jgi:hypothetical protein
MQEVSLHKIMDGTMRTMGTNEDICIKQYAVFRFSNLKYGSAYPHDADSCLYHGDQTLALYAMYPNFIGRRRNCLCSQSPCVKFDAVYW